MSSIKRMLNMTLLAGVMGLIFAGFASAEVPPTTVTVLSANVTPTIYGASAKASDVATGKVTILQDMRVKASVKTSNPKCKWSKGGFWNSGHGTNGARSFWDPVPGKLCPSKASKTGWVKVAGGTSGRNCGNVASFGKPAYPVVKGKVLMVRSFANIRVKLDARAEVKVTAVCGYAYAKAVSSVSISLQAFVKARGSVSERITGEVLAKATAEASAKLECFTAPLPVPPVPPVPPTPPAVPPAAQPPMLSNPTNPEEIYSNGETYANICVTVSGKNGNSLTISFGSIYGSFGTSIRTITSSGVDKVCNTYTAPRDASAAGRSEQISYNVHDNTTGLNGPSVTSLAFPIKAPPARP